MLELLALISLLLTAAAGAVVTFLALRSKCETLESNVRALQAAAFEVEKNRSEMSTRASEGHASALRKAEENFAERLREQSQSGLSVTVHPFVNTSKQKGLFTSETLVEVGYKYQLLIQGLPCFEPHTVVVETTREKEVNDETIELLKSKAVELAQLAASAKSGGLSAAFTIARAAVQRIK